MLNCNANVIPQLSFWVEMSTASGGNRAGPENCVCLYVWLPPVKWFRIHNSTASFLSLETAIKDISKADGEETRMRKKTVVFFPACNLGTHFASTLRITLLKIIFRQKRGKGREKRMSPILRIVVEVAQLEPGQFHK